MVVTCVASGLLLLAPCTRSDAAVYGYVDAEGTAHFTDAPTKTEYRWLPGFGLPPGVNLERGQYAELIDTIAADNGVDPALVRAIIRAESNFDRRAISRKGAQGLMQLMPGTAGQYAVGNAFDPAENIRGGVRHLRSRQDRFPGQLHLAIAAYNAGEGAVSRHKGVPPYAETRQYVARVLRHYDQANVLPVTARRAGPEDRAPAGPTAAKVYRQFGPDGTPLYSNLPPLIRTQSAPAR